AILSRSVVHVADVLADPDYAQDLASAGNLRAILSVPMLRDGQPIGVITVSQSQPRPFSERQGVLLKIFADQAVIAIQNARLFAEVQARTRQLQEALEQQTATAELLKVIGRSALDLNPVFETLIESAVKLCGAKRGFVARFDGEQMQFVAGYNVTPQLKQYFEEHPFSLDRHSNTGRAAVERRTIHNIDVQSDPEYTYGGA